MKRGLFVLLISLLIIPLANAEQLTLKDISISPATIQLGDQFTISGEINKGESLLDTGFVIIRLKGMNFIREYSAEVVNGRFSVTATIYKKTKDEEIQAGEYTVDLTVNDGFGEEIKFSNVGLLSINRLLQITLELAENSMLPGETLKIIGNARKINGELVSGTVNFVLDNQMYKGVFNEGSFEYNIELSESIKSYSHTMTAKVEDEYGNNAESLLTFSVVPVEKSLNLVLEKREFLAGEQVKIESNLVDQAGDRINRDVSVKVRLGRKELLNKQVNGVVMVQLDKYALPGEYIIEGKSKDLETTSEFLVKALPILDIRLDGTDLIVENIGNVEYTKRLIITAISSKDKETLERRTNLKPKELTTINLLTALKPGSYDISVLNKTFEDVLIRDSRSIFVRTKDSIASITGNVIVASGSSSSNNALILLVLIGVLVIGYVINKKMKKNKALENRRKEEIKMAQRYKQRLQESTPLGNKLRRPFRATESEVEGFKKRILENAKKEEERQRVIERERLKTNLANSYRSVRPSEPSKNVKEESNGLFKMFD